MYQELSLSLYKNITKFIVIFSVTLSFQFLHAESSFDASNSSISLISESYTALEGDDLLVGVKFELEDGWHTCWKNPGDAGEGASIEWNLTEGLIASKILWPGPHKIPVEVDCTDADPCRRDDADAWRDAECHAYVATFLI